MLAIKLSLATLSISPSFTSLKEAYTSVITSGDFFRFFFVAHDKRYILEMVLINFPFQQLGMMQLQERRKTLSGNTPHVSYLARWFDLTM